MTGLPSSGMGYGVVKLLGGLAFCLGLVAVAGFELFTGSNLSIMAFAGGRITLTQPLRDWEIVYVDNFGLDLDCVGHAPDQAVHVRKRWPRGQRSDDRQREMKFILSSSHRLWLFFSCF